MQQAVLGTRIRERRRAIGLTQAALAGRIGISASYLNLIERNRRRIAGALLRRAAEALELRIDELDGVAERRLLEGLDALAQAPDIRALGVEAESTGELIARYPGWARALVALARSERQSAAVARAMTDRLSHDPFLGETVHRMLTRIAAVRSVAEILHDFPDTGAGRRERFHRILYEESQHLSDVGSALAAYFDKLDETERVLTPVDEVEALFGARANRFEEIDAEAEALAPDLAGTAPGSRREAALALARGRFGTIVDRILAEQDQVETTAARARAREALIDYGANAIMLPMTAFAARAADLHYDIEALADAFALGFGTVCQRLTSLPRADALPRFGYVSANAAGTTIEMYALPGLVAPRYAAACPLWALYRAQQSPGILIRQRAVFPSGARFILLARAHPAGPTGFGRPRHYLTDMAVLSEADAALTVYAPAPEVLVEEVGPACRICPRRSCIHRVDDPLAG